MKSTRFHQLVKECIEEVLGEGRQICAWCKKDMGMWDNKEDTHGICPDCSAQWMVDLEKMKTNPQPPEMPPIRGTQIQ